MPKKQIRRGAQIWAQNERDLGYLQDKWETFYGRSLNLNMVVDMALASQRSMDEQLAEPERAKGHNVAVFSADVLKAQLNEKVAGIKAELLEQCNHNIVKVLNEISDATWTWKLDPEDPSRVWFQSEKKGFNVDTSHWLDGYPIPDAVGIKAMIGRRKTMLKSQKIIRLKDVVELVGLSKTTIWRRMRAGEFPPALRLGGPQTRAVGWRATDVEAWQRQLRTKS